ncbi:hypothetical protein CHLRE_02g141200v5 [Chlamydomonas reinhardtii]|uniref:Nicotinate-nucleotide pyrophosphorylase [carboxylating] n=1 Tax=Chlamydomonas reinhardtii TaxID=3055 RepID=A8J0N3_CHLRE|nr:nicotinate-nucleotide diphosphorylase (carboxylating) [Chlamydomonas reinhardtii]PNW87561.1 hypothetical protein CHLRE_02g141200v5 [Chlamydomonas reinhardtii]|eukprot:XP_001694961.1 nicotinate-nucleotide diphosphorylase (carboxylating) [Chlamydomonas reinhardtii]
MATKSHAPVPCPVHPTANVTQAIKAALDEDAGDRGDVTTLATIPESTQATATFLAKADGVLAGLGVADEVLAIVDPTVKVEWRACDGDKVVSGQVLGVLHGSARSILVAERIMLNFMQRMSGIATATAAMVAALEGLPTKVLETRKTAPGLRLTDKWAVLIGGGSNHRMGLYDMMMIKDNHIAAAGGIRAAVQRAEEYIRSADLEGRMCIEVETSTLAEVDEVVELLQAARQDGAPRSHLTRVMLDNMARRDPAKEGGVDVSLMAEAVGRIGDLAETEGSGNVSLNSIRTIAATGVTFVSVGALTHSVIALDISLKIKTL